MVIIYIFLKIFEFPANFSSLQHLGPIEIKLKFESLTQFCAKVSKRACVVLRKNGRHAQHIGQGHGALKQD